MSVLSDLIEVRLDGQPQMVAKDSALEALVALTGHAPQAVATAVNGEFVPRSARAERLLQPGDAVLLFQPIVGG